MEQDSQLHEAGDSQDARDSSESFETTASSYKPEDMGFEADSCLEAKKPTGCKGKRSGKQQQKKKPRARPNTPVGRFDTKIDEQYFGWGSRKIRLAKQQTPEDYELVEKLPSDLLSTNHTGFSDVCLQDRDQLFTVNGRPFDWWTICSLGEKGWNKELLTEIEIDNQLCKACVKDGINHTFSSFQERRMHERKVHKDFDCRACDKPYTNSGSLSKHQTKRSPKCEGIVAKCPRCEQ